MGNTLSGKRYIDITLTGTPNTCTVAIRRELLRFDPQ